jgi:SAM-dependent methyltransferase
MLSADQALTAWAERVRLNREQVEQHKEAEAGRDFYAPVASLFRADPSRTDDPVLDVLRTLVRPDDTVLDIGAGGGRYALPLALVVREVLALDPSEGMLAILGQGMAEHGITNVRLVQSRWPVNAATAEQRGASAPERKLEADVALIAHVGYDIEQIGPFLDAMERAARRLCVAVLLDGPPPSAADQLWPEIHGLQRASLPALREFLEVLLARGTLFEVRLMERTPMSYAEPEQALAWARQQLWTRPGSAKDQRLQRLVHERLIPGEGGLTLAGQPRRVGVVTWH